jgi:hypothetical protein
MGTLLGERARLPPTVAVQPATRHIAHVTWLASAPVDRWTFNDDSAKGRDVDGQEVRRTALLAMSWMACQYSTRGLVSSEKHETPSEAGGEGRGGDTLGVAIAAEVMGGYGPLLEPPAVVSRAAKLATTLQSRTPAKLYSRDTLLQRLAQDLDNMAPDLRPFIQEENVVVRPRDLARHGEVPAAGQPHVRDRMMGARNGRVVTTVVRAPVRPATRWMRVVSRASARGSAVR